MWLIFPVVIDQKMKQTRKNIVLIGGGGHCKSCIEVLESKNLYNIIGILDLPSEMGKKVFNYEVIGNDDDYQKFHNQGCAFVITAGQIKSADLRKRIFENLKTVNAEIETVIASTALVSKYATIAEGSIIMHNSFINSGAIIGENCIINTASIIEHDASIGKHTHISTSATVNGNCIIGDETFIGSGTIISNNVKIGDKVLIGAGSLVLNNITEAGTYVGNPIRKLK